MKLQSKKVWTPRARNKDPTLFIKTSFYTENQFLKLTIGKDERELQVLKTLTILYRDTPIK